ncbi:MAG: hypothetical protein V1779_16870 [bacterium]
MKTKQYPSTSSGRPQTADSRREEENTVTDRFTEEAWRDTEKKSEPLIVAD